MRTRRGSSLWGTSMSGAAMVSQYKPGDVVYASIIDCGCHFTGVVREVCAKTNKVLVAWGGGALSQHDPDELMPAQVAGVKIASRRAVAPPFEGAPASNPSQSVEQTDFLSPEMERLLNEQVGMEFFSAYVYFAAAAWFQSKGLVGFYDWMKRQGEDEVGHTLKVYEYLLDTGSKLALPPIKAPEANWSSVAEVTRAVLDHEMAVTQAWKVIGQAAKSSDNPATCKLVQEFVEEQVEEEDAAVTLHQKVQMAGDGSGILIIDTDLKDRDPNEADKTASKKAAVDDIDSDIAGWVRDEYIRVKESVDEAAEEYADENEKSEKGGRGVYHRETMNEFRSAALGKLAAVLVKESKLKVSSITAADPNTDPQYMGDPDTHGVNEPRGGGFSIMQQLQKDLHEESKAQAGEKTAAERTRSLRSRRAMYWSAPTRVYRMTRKEVADNVAICPRCGEPMGADRFTRSEKLFMCPCGFKIPTGSVVKNVEELMSRRKVASFATRMCSTQEQEDVVAEIEGWLRRLGKKVVGGTTIGKAPQSVVLDLTHQGGEIHVNRDGEITVKTEGVPAGDFATFKKLLVQAEGVTASMPSRRK